MSFSLFYVSKKLDNFHRYYISKALDAENKKARDMYLDQARNEAYTISDEKERQKALAEIESFR